VCNTLVKPACAVVSHLVGPVTASFAGDVLSSLASAISGGVRWAVENTAAWWVTIPSPDLTSAPAITAIQAWLLPVTAAVAVAATIAAGARMAIARRANPLLDVTSGLITLAAATTVGTVVPALLLKAGDAWSAWVLQASTGGQFAHRMAEVLVLGSTAAPAVVMIFGVIAIVLSLVQAVLMLFRQAALVILAGVLPLAAAGSIAPLTRPWIRKISSWMLALIFYKPAAAAVYAAAFTMTGSGRDPRTVLMGFVMLLLSVITLPALMKFFTWTTGTVGGSGGGGQLLGAAAAGAVAVSALRSPRGGQGGPAQDQATYLNNRLGTSNGGDQPTGTGGPAGPPGQPAAPGAPPTRPGPAGSTGPPASSAASATTAARAGAADMAAGAGPVPAGAASAPTATPGAAATGATAAAGPTGAAAAAAAGAAARRAAAAMDPEDPA